MNANFLVTSEISFLRSALPIRIPRFGDIKQEIFMTGRSKRAQMAVGLFDVHVRSDIRAKRVDSIRSFSLSQLTLEQ